MVEEEDVVASALRLLAQMQAEAADEADERVDEDDVQMDAATAAADGSGDEGDVVADALRLLAELQAAAAAGECHECDDDDDGGSGGQNDGADLRQPQAARHNGIPRRHPNDWSPWSARAVWTLHGFTWEECTSTGTPVIDRVRTILNDNPWCWRADLLWPDMTDVPQGRGGWFHIKPQTVTPSQARYISLKVHSMIDQDWIGLHGTARQRTQSLEFKRLPEDRQPCDPHMWIEHAVYFWNISLGKCSAAHCCEDGKPLVFRGVQGSFNTTWSLARRYPQCFHQWWNITGAQHTRCNAIMSSHITNGYDKTREEDYAVQPFVATPDIMLGGPSRYFILYHGGTTRPLPNISPTNKRRTNYRWLNSWLDHMGYKHFPDCNNRGFLRRANQPLGSCFRDDCPYGQKRIQLIIFLGGEDAMGT